MQNPNGTGRYISCTTQTTSCRKHTGFLVKPVEAPYAELRRGFGITLQLMATVYIILIPSDTFVADMDFKVGINQE